VVSLNKPIRLSGHARDQAAHRGASAVDIEEAIRSQQWRPAEGGRLECRKEFAFNAEWNSRHYATRQVRPIFIEEADEIVVVTVYVYYF
jgi:hypothetical protein